MGASPLQQSIGKSEEIVCQTGPSIFPTLNWVDIKPALKIISQLMDVNHGCSHESSLWPAPPSRLNISPKRSLVNPMKSLFHLANIGCDPSSRSHRSTRTTKRGPAYVSGSSRRQVLANSRRDAWSTTKVATVDSPARLSRSDTNGDWMGIWWEQNPKTNNLHGDLVFLMGIWWYYFVTSNL